MPDNKGNYERQDKGFDLLRAQLPGFYLPSSAEKDRILEFLGVSRRFKQTFDAIVLKVATFAEVNSAKDFDLIEIKTTGACLPQFPEGFFFGMTENEEMLLKVFEGKYFLCLVCLHDSGKQYKLLGWDGLKALTQNKRVQYQINLLGGRSTKTKPQS